MKKIVVIILTFASIFNSFSQNKTKTFNINGTVKNIADSTWLFLSDLADGSYKDIDSTLVLKEKFQFRGKLNHDIVNLAIHTKDFKDRVTFWVDHNPTVISAEKGKFKTASIKGSKAQEKKYELDALTNNPKTKNQDYVAFIQKNPTSILSAALLKVYSSTWNKDTVSMLYERLSPEAKKTIYGAMISDFLTYNQTPKIGDRYVDFEQTDINGKNIKLSDFHGKIVLLEFWGSWCGPCREGHPRLIQTYEQFKAKGFEILGVAADTDLKILTTAIQKDKLPWQNVSDLRGDQNKAALIYGVSYYPANFLIDQNGIIIAKDLRDEKLYEKLKELFR
jgi:peroxiredoxin